MHPDYIPPIRPSGVNSLEARVKALEVAQAYDVQALREMREDLHSAHQEIGALKVYADTTQRRAAAWVISALMAAVASLALIVIKIKAPWMLTP